MTHINRLACLALLVAALWWEGAESQVCPSGWFGSTCQYKCYCDTTSGCETNGTCTGSCAQGWFGPACQYVDLVATIPTATRPTWLGDCSRGQGSPTVTVVFTEVFYFTWLRLRVDKPVISLDFVVQFNGTSTSCYRNLRVSDTEVDIQCDPGVPFKNLTLSGPGVSSMCSLYVSGGRNVALKQNVTQTSNLNSLGNASNAVDGNTNSDYAAGSCSHTNGGIQQTWTLTFQKERRVSRYVIYNRDVVSERLQRFILTANKTDRSPAFRYQDTSGSPQSIYYIPSSAPDVGIASVGIAVNDYLTLCEVEMYGDTVCTTGTYGRECEKRCNCDQTGDNCLVSTGGCPSGCATGYQGEDCQSKCDPTHYGKGCAQNCSSNCMNQLCDAINGNCLSCIPGKKGSLCDEDCSATFFGENCDQSCSQLCKDQLCDGLTGTCNSCIPGKQGTNCSQDCNATFFGENCAQNCSSNCKDRLCDRVDGTCFNCTSGNVGPMCNGLVGGPGPDPVPVGAIVGAIVGFIVLVLLIIIGVFICRRHRHKKAVPRSESHLDDVPESMSGNSEAVPKSRATAKNGGIPMKQKPPVKAKPDLSEGHKGEQNSAQEGTYCNHVPGLSDTSIRAQDLNTFIASNTKEFYQKQFASIPASSTATITVGTSPANQHKNRYKNICAYDHSRVHLQVNSSKKHGDYINASYINGFKIQKQFIASQGPTEVILEDFVRMLWEQGTEVVVMLTSLIEEGKLKCVQYWPDDGQKAFGEITVNLTTTQVFADYTIRRLELHKKAEPTQTLTHFHFTAWPDKDVPTTAWGLVDLEQRMAHITTDKPIVVHCSAGVGRTGTFIALHNVLEEIKETGSMNFFSTVQKLRSDRVFMVQTYGQYEFLHKATQIALVCKGTTVTAGDIEDRIKTLEGVSLSGPINLEKEFRSVCLVCDDSDYASIEEESAEGMYYNSRMVTNKTKNRLYNILPKEYYRPILSCASEDMSDYINAVFVPSSKSHDHQLLTQLPLPATIPDLWRLVSQYKVALIVAFEKDLKAEDMTIGDYFPEGDNVNTTSSSFNIKGRSVESDVNWKVHKIVITEDAKTKDGAGNRDYCLSHVTCASTNLQPEDLLALVRKVRTMKPVGEGRILYMCRDGATFSGLVCVMSLLLDRMDYDQCVSVPLVVGAVKAIRPQVIPTLDQYRLLYQVLQLFVETNNVYSNFDSVRPTHFTAVI